MRDRGRSVAKFVFLIALAGFAAVALAGPGTRFGVWDFRFALGVLMQYGAYVSMAAAALAVLWLVAAAVRRRWAGAPLAVAALVLAGAGFGFPLAFRAQAQSVPAIHDITTDMENPPAFVAVVPLRAGALNPPEYAGPDTAAKQAEAYPDIKPFIVAMDRAALFAKALAAAKEMGWEIVAALPEEGRIEATDTTMWFGFKDDVVIRIRDDEAGSRLDIRSKSRVGISDVGANAARIRAFLKKLA